MIGTQILLSSELLIESLDVHAAERVLDVATGSGNAAMAAARRGCTVVGIDYVPSLLDRARQRAAAEGVERRLHRGRRRGAPVRGRAASTSSPRSSARCSRRTRTRPRTSSHASPGPAAGSASSRTRRTGSSAACSRSSPATSRRRPGLRSPIQWGTEDRLRELFGDSASPRSSVREAAHHLALPVAGGLRRLLAPLLRPDAQGVRGCRRGRPRRARSQTCSTSSRASTAPTTAR